MSNSKWDDRINETTEQDFEAAPDVAVGWRIEGHIEAKKGSSSYRKRMKKGYSNLKSENTFTNYLVDEHPEKVALAAGKDNWPSWKNDLENGRVPHGWSRHHMVCKGDEPKQDYDINDNENLVLMPYHDKDSTDQNQISHDELHQKILDPQRPSGSSYESHPMITTPFMVYPPLPDDHDISSKEDVYDLLEDIDPDLVDELDEEYAELLSDYAQNRARDQSSKREMQSSSNREYSEQFIEAMKNVPESSVEAEEIEEEDEGGSPYDESKLPDAHPT
jgi:hypothetical protein